MIYIYMSIYLFICVCKGFTITKVISYHAICHIPWGNQAIDPPMKHDAPWCWYIYLHDWTIFGGKCRFDGHCWSIFQQTGASGNET